MSELPIITSEASAMDRVLKPRPSDGMESQPWSQTGTEPAKKLEHEHGAKSEGHGSGELKIEL